VDEVLLQYDLVGLMLIARVDPPEGEDEGEDEGMLPPRQSPDHLLLDQLVWKKGL
jgi:hypothetical protein